MNKSVLLSIKPKWCKLIASGRKTLELRKIIPKLEPPYTCYIYCTKDNYPMGDSKICKGKVIGKFTCDAITRHCEMLNADIAEIQGCIHREEILQYARDKEIRGLHISDVIIYDKPKDISDFMKFSAIEYDDEIILLNRPPQSWCYVAEILKF